MSHETVQERDLHDMRQSSGKVIDELDPRVQRKFIGAGRDCFVFDLGDHEVLAINWHEKSKEEMIALYELAMIYWILFPANFPEIFYAFSKDEGIPGCTGTVRRLIKEPEEIQFHIEQLRRENGVHDLSQEDRDKRLLEIAEDLEGRRRCYREELGEDGVVAPFSNVRVMAELLGVPLLLDDFDDHNFALGADHHEYYLDTPVYKWFDPSEWDEELIAQRMLAAGYSMSQIQRVCMAIWRLKQVAHLLPEASVPRPSKRN